MKNVLLGIMLFGFVLSLYAGGTQEADEGKKVELRFVSSQIGVHPEAPWLEKTIENFNKMHEGTINVLFDGVAGYDAAWMKISSDAATGDTPNIFMLAAQPKELEIMSEADAVVDLFPLFEKEPEYKSRLNDDASVKAYTVDGKLMGLPYAKAYIGIFYNKEHFADAGISVFPKTWTEFGNACNKLKSAGHTPLALMTQPSAWTAQLIMSAYIGTTDKGRSWLNTPSGEKNFVDQVFIDGVTKIQEYYFNYTTPDAIGSEYGVAANNFLQGKASMIANGPWMIGDFSNPDIAPEGFADKVAYEVFPGNVVISFENISYAVGKATPEEEAASWEFIKYLMDPSVYGEFLTISGNAPTFKTDMSLIIMDRIKEEFTPKAVNAAANFPHFLSVTTQEVNDSLEQTMPALASGDLSPLDFAQECQKYME